MILDQKGRDFIQSNEGLRLKAYLDGGGLPTIGYGTTIYPTGVKAKMGDMCTKEQANEYFVNDSVKFEVIINRAIINPKYLDKDYLPKSLIPELTQNQFNALVSLVYNIGGANFNKSTLLKVINSKDRNNRELIEQNFLSWNKIRINGKLIASDGLTNRREKEVELYFS